VPSLVDGSNHCDVLKYHLRIQTFSNEQDDKKILFLAGSVVFVSTTVFGGDDNSTDAEVENHHCKLDTDEEEWKFRTVALPAGFIEPHQSSFSNNPILNITNVVVTNDAVELSGASEVSLHHETSPHRRLAPKIGSPTVLSVYITSSYPSAIVSHAGAVSSVNKAKYRPGSSVTALLARALVSEMQSLSLGSLRMLSHSRRTFGGLDDSSTGQRRDNVGALSQSNSMKSLSIVSIGAWHSFRPAIMLPEFNALRVVFVLLYPRSKRFGAKAATTSRGARQWERSTRPLSQSLRLS
jgi:hypothetical protein